MTVLKDRWVAWMKANPKPSDAANWNQQCGKGQFRFNSTQNGWISTPRVTGPGAIDVARASGSLNKDWASAPIGAWHYWSIGTYGHVGQDATGGGREVAMIGTAKLAEKIINYGGFQSVTGYGTATYMGWATNYGGGVANIPAEPVVVVEPNQRQVLKTAAVKRRAEPYKDDTQFPGINPPIPSGTITTPLGWEYGSDVDGNEVWFKNADNTYSHSSGFTNITTDNLKDLNEKPDPDPGTGPTAEEIAIATETRLKPYFASIDAKLDALAKRPFPTYVPKE